VHFEDTLKRSSDSLGKALHRYEFLPLYMKLPDAYNFLHTEDIVHISFDPIRFEHWRFGFQDWHTTYSAKGSLLKKS